MDCTKNEQFTSNENHSQQNNLNYFTIPLKINSLGRQKVLDKAFIVSYNSMTHYGVNYEIFKCNCKTTRKSIYDHL